MSDPIDLSDGVSYGEMAEYIDSAAGFAFELEAGFWANWKKMRRRAMFTRIWKSKTFWGGLATVVTGAGLCVAGNVMEGLQLIATGVMAMFIRDAVAKGK